MKTFEKEVSYVSWEVDTEKNESVETVVTKTATFKELSRTDKTQHKLHFKLISLVEGLKKEKGEENSIGISSDGLYDITVKAINILFVPTDSFTEQDKKEFLNDSMALLDFGLWLFKEQFTPFFAKSKMT
jgi:hypothetical protein